MDKSFLRVNNSLNPEITNQSEGNLQESLRPTTFHDYVGQDEEVDNIRVFVKAAHSRHEPVCHILLCGPPGLGKTTLAYIIAQQTGARFEKLNAVSSGVKEVRAVIDEAWCIGCTLCIKACPTDAIFGSNKRMHTVIERHCTGCELCIPACPVDCIVMRDLPPDHPRPA